MEQVLEVLEDIRSALQYIIYAVEDVTSADLETAQNFIVEASKKLSNIEI